MYVYVSTRAFFSFRIGGLRTAVLKLFVGEKPRSKTWYGLRFRYLFKYCRLGSDIEDCESEREHF
jgi:hypothetical protein